MSEFTTTTTNNNNPFFKAMDGQTMTENGHFAVSSGKGGGVRKAQTLMGKEFEAALTDIFSQIVRDKNHDEFRREIRELFDVIYKNNQDSEKKLTFMKYLCKFMMNIRDPREGKGERDLFHIMFIELYQHQSEMASNILPTLEKYGSFLDFKGLWVRVKKLDDISVLNQYYCSKFKSSNPQQILAKLKKEIGDLICTILLNKILVDLTLKQNSKPYSLCAKHIPREAGRTKDKKTIDSKLKGKLFRQLAEMWYKELPTVRDNLSSVIDDKGELNDGAKKFARTEFRKIISSLRKSIIVERQMSGNQWDQIEFGKVPAGANKKYGKMAFQNLNRDKTKKSTDEKRVKCSENYHEACQNAIQGKKGGIKGKAAGATAPVQHYMRGGSYDESVEAMYADLVRVTKQHMNEAGGIPSNVIISDVSGSMAGVPMEVCIALSLVLQEITPEPWNGRVITFSSTPEWHKIEGKTLQAKVHCLKNAPWGGSTNFVSSMKLILDMAIQHGLTQEQMPKMLFCFSDMQFDEAHGTYGSSSNSGYVHAFSSVKAMFEREGYQVPHIVFWNLRATNAQPCETISEGVSTMSGYSENMFKAFLKGEFANIAMETPWDRVKKVLDNEHYDDLDKIVEKYII
jgi:hypothetical protein